MSCQAAEVLVSRRRWLVRSGIGVPSLLPATGITLVVAGGGSAAPGTPGGLLEPRRPGQAAARAAAWARRLRGRARAERGAPCRADAPFPSAGRWVASRQSGLRPLFHWHAALTVFASGKQSQVPAGVGIDLSKRDQRNSKGQPYIKEGKCFYRLHTARPRRRLTRSYRPGRGFTLGDFFDEWGLPLSTDQPARRRGTSPSFTTARSIRATRATSRSSTRPRSSLTSVHR